MDLDGFFLDFVWSFEDLRFGLLLSDEPFKHPRLLRLEFVMVEELTLDRLVIPFELDIFRSLELFNFFLLDRI